MNSAQQEFRELLSLSLSHILDHFRPEEDICTDSETYDFYQKFQSPPLKTTQEKTIQPSSFSPPAAGPAQTFVKSAPAPNNVAGSDLKKTPEVPSGTPSAPIPITEGSRVYSKTPDPSLFTFTLDPMSVPKEYDLTKIQKEMSQIFPQLEIIDKIPEYTGPQPVQNRATGLPEVIFLTFSESPEEKEFLKKVADAVTARFCSAAVYSAFHIESKNKWADMFRLKGLRFIVASESGILSMPNLLAYYRRPQRYLGGLPVLLISDPEVYLRQPELKHSLWQAICTSLKDLKK